MATNQQGFFQTLFDFDFTSFITIRFIKVIYAITLGVLALLALTYLVLAFSTQEPLIIVLAIFVVPLATLASLLAARITLEAVVVFFRIGENTSILAAAEGRPNPLGGSPWFGEDQAPPQ